MPVEFRSGALVALVLFVVCPARGATEVIRVTFTDTSVTLACPWVNSSVNSSDGGEISSQGTWTATEKQMEEIERGAVYLCVNKVPNHLLKIYVKGKAGAVPTPSRVGLERASPEAKRWTLPHRSRTRTTSPSGKARRRSMLAWYLRSSETLRHRQGADAGPRRCWPLGSRMFSSPLAPAAPPCRGQGASSPPFGLWKICPLPHWLAPSMRPSVHLGRGCLAPHLEEEPWAVALLGLCCLPFRPALDQMLLVPSPKRALGVPLHTPGQATGKGCALNIFGVTNSHVAAQGQAPRQGISSPPDSAGPEPPWVGPSGREGGQPWAEHLLQCQCP